MTTFVICESLLGLAAILLVAVLVHLVREKAHEARTTALRARLEAMKAAQHLSSMAWETRQAMRETVRDHLRSHM